MSEPKEVPGLHEYLSAIRTVEEAFAVYRKFVIPPDAGEIQVRESRRAFFASADWFFKRFLTIVDNEPDAQRWLSEIHEELDKYAKAVQEGRA